MNTPYLCHIFMLIYFSRLLLQSSSFQDSALIMRNCTCLVLWSLFVIKWVKFKTHLIDRWISLIFSGSVNILRLETVPSGRLRRDPELHRSSRGPHIAVSHRLHAAHISVLPEQRPRHLPAAAHLTEPWPVRPEQLPADRLLTSDLHRNLKHNTRSRDTEESVWHFTCGLKGTVHPKMKTQSASSRSKPAHKQRYSVLGHHWLQ